VNCYGINTDPIDRLNDLLRIVSRDRPTDWTDEDNPLFHMRPEQSIAIATAYLDAFSCFLNILRAVMARRIDLLGGESGRSAYLQPFLIVYSDAILRLDSILRSLFQDIFTDNAGVGANFVGQIVASGTPAELAGYISVPTAESAEEAKEHGEAGKQVADSIKRLLRMLLLKVPFLRLKSKKNREEWADHTLHAINEVLGVVFRTVA
jgi:hypothetical protein